LTIKLQLKPNPFQIPESDLTRTFKIDRDSISRLRIKEISADSQAEALRLRIGDVILKYDGKSITNTDELSSAKEAAKDTVTMILLRDGQEMSVNLKKGKIGVYTEEVYE
jgi:S1-C subfamily serine protease